MREIKLRAWDNSTKYWLDMYFFFKFINGTLKYTGVDNVVIEQYTGIKDKNGANIYENDIVKASGSNIYVVEFFDGKFNPVSELEGSDWEVIGNIHQDSDLLVDDIERMIPDDIGNDIHEFLHGGDK